MTAVLPDDSVAALERAWLTDLEDEAIHIIREVLGQFLTKKGFRVEAAATGEEGLALARRLRPVAVTLDVTVTPAYRQALIKAGKLDVTATVTFTNATGRTASRPIKVTLLKK